MKLYFCFYSTEPKQNFIRKERIFGLDLLRAIAIIAVLLSHTTPFLKPLISIHVLGSGVGSFLQFCRPLGQLGVELFFVLSGFLIGTIFLNTFITSPDFGISDIRAFLVRRWFRTLPNYWLILTVNILLYAYLHAGAFNWYWLQYYIFIQNLWYPHPPSFFGEAWSIAVEEWFYLLFPMGIYIGYRYWKPFKKRTFFLRALLVFLSFFLLLRIANALISPHINIDAAVRKVVVFRLDALGYGVLAAYAVYFKKDRIKRIQEKLFGIGIAGILLLYYLIAEDGANICNATIPLIKFCSDAFLYLLLPIVCALLLPLANSAITTPYRWFKSSVTFISKISYSLYLIHFSLIYIPFFERLEIRNPILLMLAYTGYWCITVALSYFIYRYFEMPVMNMRNKYAGTTIF